MTTMEFANTVRRAQEDPRTTLPYTAAQIDDIQQLGEAVDGRLQAAGLELTMGGEPTFVSADDMTAAVDGGCGRPGEAGGRQPAGCSARGSLCKRRAGAAQRGQVVSRRAAASLADPPDLAERWRAAVE